MDLYIILSVCKLLIKYPDLIVALISLTVAIALGICQVCQANRVEAFERRLNDRDEKRYKDLVYSQATQFIQKYSVGEQEAEIHLLPLCIAAYKYNLVYPYRREIYREFCGLTEDIRDVILQRCEIDIPCTRSDNYYVCCLRDLLEDIKIYCPEDRDIFYDGGKYLERALLDHGPEPVTDIRCAVDKWEDNVNKLCERLGGTPSPDMSYRKHILNLLFEANTQQPIDILWVEGTSLGRPCDGDEILTCYLCCIIAQYVPCYLHNTNEQYNTGLLGDYAGVRYMEDEFLEALSNITVYGE